MPNKMHAAVVEQFGTPLALRDWDIPVPGPGQILVKTLACGVCHTDLHAAHGDWPVKPTLPFIPGHEAIGVVAAAGKGVTLVKEGDRVGVPWLYSACGHCEYCLAAWETVCDRAEFGGYTKNGGFAEYIPGRPELRRTRARRPSRQGRRADHLRGASPPTRRSSKPRRSRENGSPFQAWAAWATWRFSTPRSWDFSSAPSTSTTPSWPMPSAASGPMSR